MSESGEYHKQSYRDLKVWQVAVDLSVAIFGLTDSYPKSDLYGLTAQMRRCAASIPANIAEGCARKGAGEFLQFLHVAAGSLGELDTFLEIGRRLGYGNVADYEDMMSTSAEVGRMLYGLIASIRQGSRRATGH